MPLISLIPANPFHKSIELNQTSQEIGLIELINWNEIGLSWIKLSGIKIRLINGNKARLMKPMKQFHFRKKIDEIKLAELMAEPETKLRWVIII